ncbi:MAG: hypothetical protein ABWX59_07515 [Microbacteriaceae bacterium]
MTDTYGTGVPTGTGAPPNTVASTGYVSSDAGLKEQTGQLGHDAANKGQHVAGVAKDQAGRVAEEAGTQARRLYYQARGELTDQASTQQQRVASGLRSMSDELRQMGDNSEQSGMARDLVRQAADRTGAVADWLNQRDPGSLLDEVKQFARRRPGVFIAVAVGAGLVAGRLTRAMVSEAKDESERSGDSASTYGTTTPPSAYTPPTTATGMPSTGMPPTQAAAPVSATETPRTGTDPDLVPPEAPGSLGGRMGGAG